MKTPKVIACIIAFITGLAICTTAQTLSSAREVLNKEINETVDMKEEKASTSLAAVVFKSEDKFAVRLHFENFAKGNVTIKLKSVGTVLYQEVIDKAVYARKFDMFNLPNGDYKVEISNENQTYTKKIKIKSHNGVRDLILID